MGWAIGKASELSGVGIETIRYYEREGITSKPPRTSAGRRDYDAQTISQLRFVKRCRELGFSIPDITELMKLSYSDKPTCEEAGKIGTDNLALVRQKIADLKCMEQALQELVASCRTGRKDCPMLKKLFAD
ncbi:MAG: MerR family transcriptional regulator [Rhizobiales bacterium]|nr:MerR family transcriptional regulator [Hyphomicrobiales bacterium]MBO6697822.1 MerR family transcriptional regulator [Hyphomicrobiales bacterium]MBO6735923.1 MerR family transcriptional regulator [Hyphomicrobiales bacterium]MBO6912393.1 MerR family transcriptional regulator [Hyphomicrobiales bacterium]MBO6955023.1 MerR family transcriptional regulator [Hyphomicrobiales bacterium]